MEIAKKIAGFSPAEADDLRKAIGKKIHSLMASLKEKFLEGCASNGVTPRSRNQLWADMEQAQDYSFNKSHAACYALIAYRTAWLRANHPKEYMAALISSVMNTKDQVPFYVNACHELGDRRAAAGREHVADRLRRRRGQDPLRAERGEERRRVRVPRDRARARGGRAVRVDLGLHRARRPAGREQARARVARQVRRARLDRRARGGDARVPRAGALVGQKQQADKLARPGLDLRPRRAGADDDGPRHHPTIPVARSSRRTSCCISRRRRSGCTSPSIRWRRSATSSAARPTARSTSSSAGATARSSPSAASSPSLKQMTTKKGEPMVFAGLEDVTGSLRGRRVQLCVRAVARPAACRTASSSSRAAIDHKQQGETKLVAIEVTAFEATPERKEVRLKVDARIAPAGIVRELAALVKDFPGEAPVYVDLVTSMGSKLLELGPELPGASGAGLLRRGEGPARRSCSRLTLTHTRRGTTEPWPRSLSSPARTRASGSRSPSVSSPTATRSGTRRPGTTTRTKGRTPTFCERYGDDRIHWVFGDLTDAEGPAAARRRDRRQARRRRRAREQRRPLDGEAVLRAHGR